MFPQAKRLNNESGVVLFIVLMTAIVIMIFSAGILTQSMNETKYAQDQIDQIVSDQLKKGMWWNAYSTGSLSNVGISTVMAGRNYTMTIANIVSSDPAINSYNVDVSYNAS